MPNVKDRKGRVVGLTADEQRPSAVGSSYSVWFNGQNIGRVFQRRFVRERRTEGNRYANARWDSPPIWTYGNGSFECESRRHAITELVDDAELNAVWTIRGSSLPAGDAFPDTPEFTEQFRAAATACNGVLYHGDSLEAQIRLVKWLRCHPQEAAALIGVTAPAARESQ